MPSDASRGSSRAAERRLDSWKQIASHLGRDVRTAQRWEKGEGLPVHRHQHGSRGTVFAYERELDAWLGSRTRTPEPGGPGMALDGEPGLLDGGAKEAAPARRRPPALVRAWLPLSLVLACTAWLLGRAAVDGAEGAGEARLLVLPPVAIAGDALEETIGRALHEELITGAARLAPGRLAVIGRTSALRYGATGLGLAEIGDALGVEHVLEGSIRRLEGELQVTMRLVRAVEESEVWSETFELDAAEPAPDEERVSRAVCAALAGELLGIESSPSSRPVRDPRAREAWLRGRYLWHKGTTAGFAASLPHFEEALAHDPQFVDAHVGLASAYALLGRYGSRPPAEVFPRARAEALRALELDPDAAEAHLALAVTSFYHDRDFEAAAREFRIALRLGPELALTHHVYAHFLSCLGLHDEGLESVRRARALEPLWPLVIVDTAWFHYRARDFERAAAESRRALELEPGMQSAVLCLVACLERLGDEAAACAEMRAHLDASGLLARIPGIDGDDPRDALLAVRRWTRGEVERRAREGYVPAHSQVFTLTGLGRGDEVLEWLEAGLESRDRVVLLTLVHPAFDELRSDPRYRARFQTVVDRVGFPGNPALLIARDADG